MCGRFTNKMTWREIHDLYDITNEDYRPNLRPNYNIAPTHIVPVIRPRANGRELALMRWGFEEPWAKSSIINATAEKVATSRDFLGHRAGSLARPISPWWDGHASRPTPEY